MTTIMVVEDDAALRSALVATLTANGFDTVEAGTGEEAVVLAGMRAPDLVLLDLSLPRADGFHVLSRLRSFSDVPVVVLTVRDSKGDKIMALDGGADDYVTKPFDTDELLARLRAALRRRPESSERPALVNFGELTYDRVRNVLTRHGRVVHLTPTELRLLDVLVQSNGSLVTQAQLGAALGSDERPADQAALRVYIRQLRIKLGDDAANPRFIVTHHGLGYRWLAYEDAD